MTAQCEHGRSARGREAPVEHEVSRVHQPSPGATESPCGKPVDDPCISCGRPDSTIYFRRARSRIAAIADVHVVSSGASLVCDRMLRTIRSVPTQRQFSPTHVSAAVHRFEESIAGHVYLIEVANVSKDRWRAYIVRIPGVPTALMPFYGTTPADAAEQLCSWLTRAHARAAIGAGPV
jgi:hypothetical protein